jgi:mannose-6-phosphate isomerase-like protein (cupin superfamily)
MTSGDDPDLDHVRSAMRDHDLDAEQPAPPMSHGPTEMHGDVAVTTLDVEGEERFQPLRRELGVSSFGMNLIRLRPRQQGRIHRHRRQEEVYVVVEGTLTLEVEGGARELPRGTVARVAPDVRRRLSNRSGTPLAVLAIGGAEPHEGRDGIAFASWDDHTGASPQEIPLPPDLPAP